MDSLIAAAARALAVGDPLAALTRVALRNDPAALALRGIAMAQLGDLVRARVLLRKARSGFGSREPVARARCIVAEAEIALVSRDLTWPAKALDDARATLEAHADFVNAAHARYLEVRRRLLIGQLDEAARLLGTLDVQVLPARLRTAHELAAAGIAMRRVQAGAARAAITRARRAAAEAAIPALSAEVEQALRALDAPSARVIVGGAERVVHLEDVESLLVSNRLLVDGCRNAVRSGRTVISLARRPVLFALARALGEAWPADAARDVLIARAFGGRTADESDRARLRVEIGRLRKAIHAVASIRATKRGFVLAPRRRREVVVIARPVEEEHGAILALLADGEMWSTSALSVALGKSQRTVQRALESLAATGKAQALGHGRARRWTNPPVPGFATTLLLPGPLPTD